jgi:hypothetical protein
MWNTLNIHLILNKFQKKHILGNLKRDQGLFCSLKILFPSYLP